MIDSNQNAFQVLHEDLIAYGLDTAFALAWLRQKLPRGGTLLVSDISSDLMLYGAYFDPAVLLAIEGIEVIDSEEGGVVRVAGNQLTMLETVRADLRQHGLTDARIDQCWSLFHDRGGSDPTTIASEVFRSVPEALRGCTAGFKRFALKYDRLSRDVAHDLPRHPASHWRAQPRTLAMLMEEGMSKEYLAEQRLLFIESHPEVSPNLSLDLSYMKFCRQNRMSRRAVI